MRFIRNFLALIGLVVIVLLAVGLYQAKHQLKGFDEGAAEVYLKMMNNLLKTKNAAESIVWKIPVEEGVSPEDVEEAMMAVATEHNISNVGILPLSQDIEARTGKPYRYVKIFMFCRSRTAAVMMDYSDAYSAFMPCRVTLMQDKAGKYWLYSMDMDMMIHGGATLPPELLKQALGVKKTILAIMQRGAKGDF